MTVNLDHIEPSLRPLATPVQEITPDPDNARAHEPRNIEIIKASLVSFGQQKPIVIDADGVCLAGNGTLTAARALGWTHIAATRSSLRGLQARAFGIADNRTTDTSEWNARVLAEQLAMLQNDDAVNHASTGFTDNEIEKWIGDTFELEEQTLPPEVAVTDAHHVLVYCNDEADQRTLYERLAKDGFQCRLLTL